MKLKSKFLFIALVLILSIFAFALYESVSPALDALKNYKPATIIEVYDRNNQLTWEIFEEKRRLIQLDQIPRHFIEALVAVEDEDFFQHQGFDLLAIFRATVANIRALKIVQGGSTITQQLAKAIRPTEKRGLIRKMKELILAMRIEATFDKNQILFFYLNQIYFGEGSFGISIACETYFNKPCAEMDLAESTLLAGLPNAPNRLSPIRNPLAAKKRQRLVLARLLSKGKVSPNQKQQAENEVILLNLKKNKKQVGSYYRAAVELLLKKHFDQHFIRSGGLKILTSMDLYHQTAAEAAVRRGLDALDQRQGYRGPIIHLESREEMKQFVENEISKMLSSLTEVRKLLPDGSTYDVDKNFEFTSEQKYLAVIENVDVAKQRLRVNILGKQKTIQTADLLWALNTNKNFASTFKSGDVVWVSLSNPNSGPSRFKLDQEPLTQTALISFDQKSQDILAMVGGADFNKSKFNRAVQARRQTGSIFKPILYSAALDSGFTPATLLKNEPLFIKSESTNSSGESTTRVWSPKNYEDIFPRQVPLQSALANSINRPTVDLMIQIGIPAVESYARRLGVFSPLNLDYTMALGSSSVTLYEMTKVYSQIGRLGKRVRPLLIRSIKDCNNNLLAKDISLDEKFDSDLKIVETKFLAGRNQYLTDLNNNNNPQNYFFFNDVDQLIRPQTAFLISDMLRKSRPALNGGPDGKIVREIAGKSGSTNNLVDAWYVGYSEQIVSGVWSGFDDGRTLGQSEMGGTTAAPIWADYMAQVHKGLPFLPLTIPSRIVFSEMDLETGQSPNATTKKRRLQAFLEEKKVGH